MQGKYKKKCKMNISSREISDYHYIEYQFMYSKICVAGCDYLVDMSIVIKFTVLILCFNLTKCAVAQDYMGKFWIWKWT